MAQLSYTTNMAPAFAGMKVDIGQDYVRSMVNAEATAELPFGIAVVQGTGDDACILPVDAASKYVGVVLHSHHYDPTYDMGVVGLKPKVTVNILVWGQCYVTVEEAVTVGDRVFVRHTPGTGTQRGAFRRSADAATTIEIRGARYLTSAAAGGVAQVEVDFNATRGIQP